MEVCRGLSGLKDKFRSPAVTMGNFDGVHLGHRKIFESLKAKATEIGGDAIVFTFDPHPVKVLRPEASPKLITPLREKLALIADHGIKGVILADFTKEFAAQHPVEFIESVLRDALAARLVMVGHDFTFGKGKEGTTELLESSGARLGFAVKIIDPVRVDGEIVSSTRIRRLILEGKVREAGKLLGRFHGTSGRVVEGYGRGKGLGFPTANLEVHGELIPKNGVYAVTLRIGQDIRKAIANIGVRPTFGEGERSVEVHIFDFDELLYGKELTLSFIDRIRDERPFGTPNDLAAQIQTDITEAKNILNREGL